MIHIKTVEIRLNTFLLFLFVIQFGWHKQYLDPNEYFSQLFCFLICTSLSHQNLLTPLFGFHFLQHLKMPAGDLDVWNFDNELWSFLCDLLFTLHLQVHALHSTLMLYTSTRFKSISCQRLHWLDHACLSREGSVQLHSWRTWSPALHLIQSSS